MNLPRGLKKVCFHGHVFGTARDSFAVLCFFLIAACGARSSSKTGLTPDEAFARLKPSAQNPLLCNSINSFGCGRLSLSTSTGEQSITHEDFLVSCSKNSKGLSVVARDQAGVGPGLSFGFSVAGPTEFVAEKYVCVGFELTNDPVLAKWKDKSCGVFVRYGETESWTIRDEPCSVTVEQVDSQWRGVVDCPRLTNGSQTWNFNDPAVFTCPK
ncbi:hypothetical protein EBU99_09850 [bacterium]|nr:hypothetical protein [bacterium]